MKDHQLSDPPIPATKHNDVRLDHVDSNPMELFFGRPMTVTSERVYLCYSFIYKIVYSFDC